MSDSRSDDREASDVECRDGVGVHRSAADEVACGEVAEETHFRIRAEASTEEGGHFGDDECRDDQWPGCVSWRSRLAVW